MTDSNPFSDDERFAKILNLIEEYSQREFSFQKASIQNKDGLDVIIEGLTLLGKKQAAVIHKNNEYHRRLENMMAVLLKYTLLDFSEKAEIGESGDEIDALAIGLNSLSEELKSAIELEQSRLAQIETILENAPNGVIVINEKGTVVRWNKKSEVIFGWTSEEAVNRPMHELIMPPQHIDAHHHGVERFIRTGEKHVINKTIEISAIRKNKAEFPIELSISAVKSRGEYFFIAFIADISNRKQAEEEIKRINQNLTDSVKALEAFTYSVSHDLRAPLRAIHGYMNILKDDYEAMMDERGRSMMEAVMSNSKKMGQLIDDLLSLSRLERTALHKKLVDMDELVKTVIGDIRISMNDQKTQFIVHELPDAFSDFNLIVQLYTNLISNAVKYSSLKEKPVVEIGVMKEKGEEIYFVRDNGSGFDMKFYNKLFGVFQRLHDSSEFEGNGIGLSIVKQIVTRHKGRVWADAEPGKGATFYFTLTESKEHL